MCRPLQAVTGALATLGVLGVLAGGCSASASGGTSPEAPAGDSLTAVFGDGPWRASRSLRVTAPNGDLVIVGEDGALRRLSFTLVGLAANAIDGEGATLTLNAEASALVGVAAFTNDVGAWSTSAPEASGTVAYLREGRRISGTFSLILYPVAGAAETSRSATNGHFRVTLP